MIVTTGSPQERPLPDTYTRALAGCPGRRLRPILASGYGRSRCSS
ncbi:hypothetical protein ACFQ0B_59130 [Nonomuraea thailandensis]